MALAAMGKKKSALKSFQEAVRELIFHAVMADSKDEGDLARELRRIRILEDYIKLLTGISDTLLQDGSNAVEEAFRIADAMRSRAVQRAVVASGVRTSAVNEELGELIRREQDKSMQLGALLGLFANVASALPGQQSPEAVQSLRSRIDELRWERESLSTEIGQRFPEYAEMVNPKPATIEHARSVLRPGEALISTYVGEERTYIWAVPYTGAVAFASADIGRADLTETVGLLRSALNPNATVLGDIPAFDLAVAHELYKKVMEPVKAGWKDAERILAVTHGPLGYLPLSLLPTAPVRLGPEEGALFANYRNVPWLARSHAVTVLPSVTSLRMLRGLPPGNAGRKAFAGFGDPWFSEEQAAEARLQAERTIEVSALSERDLDTRGLLVHLRATPNTTKLDSAELAKLPRLPDTADEIRSIAIALKADLTEDVFLGARANEQVVKTMNLSGYKVLAFATHGLVPGDLDGLSQPALALTAPGVAGVEGDGLLTMGRDPGPQAGCRLGGVVGL